MQVRVYATLRELVGASVLDLDIPAATDTRDFLRRLSAAYPALAEKLWDEGEQLASTIQVLVNGRSVAFLAGLDTPIRPDDRIHIFPPVGGG